MTLGDLEAQFPSDLGACRRVAVVFQAAFDEGEGFRIVAASVVSTAGGLSVYTVAVIIQ